MEGLEEFIEAIHNSPAMVVVEFTGAGAQALAWLHGVGGSSRTVLEAHDRYAAASLVETVGFEPDQFASEQVAEALATKAYLRAVHLAGFNTPVAGIGCTAAIATDRLKRGEHKGYVAAYDGRRMASYGITLLKGKRTRREEEQLISRLIVRAIAEVCKLPELPALSLTTGQESLVWEVKTIDLLDQLMAELIDWILVTPAQQTLAGEKLSHITILSGAFNPLHDGHRRLAEVAAQMSGQKVYFELPLVNADKAPIDPDEAHRRIGQFADYAPLILTRAPLFNQKAHLFPHSIFVIGADTAERLIQLRFYDNDRNQMLAALEELRVAGCHFLVAGRLTDDRFLTLRDLSIPPEYQDLFEEIPESSFRADVSSTALRRTNRK